MSDHKYPISEVFGSTMQGEGPLAGRMCYFVRFAGCDWNCGGAGGAFVCDTQYAIGPGHTGWHKDMIDAPHIAEMLEAKGAEYGDYITLSGGNPTLFVDEELASILSGHMGFKLAMETQGSVVLSSAVNSMIDCLVVSPKPPSSDMSAKYKRMVVLDLLKYRTRNQITAVKFVSFGEPDLDWIYNRYLELKQALGKQEVEWFISVGTPPKTRYNSAESGLTDLEQTRLMLCENMSDAWDMILNDPRKRFSEFRCFMQLHVAKWGRKIGV